MICNLCGDDRFTLVYKGNIAEAGLAERFSQYAFYSDIHRCAGCGLVAQKPEHAADEILARLKAETYLDEAIGGFNLAEKRHHFRMLIRQMRSFGPLEGAAVLDVGANTGVFLDCLRPLTENLHGIEPSTEAAQFAMREYGLDVRNAAVVEADLADSSFDVVTMWDVIEHLTDPSGDLARLFAKLKPGGRLFVTTHDIDGLFARVTGRHYPMLMYQHFYHFSKRTLALMLERLGYRVLGARYHAKSWSVAYLHELIGKLWPESPVAGAARLALAPLARLPGVRELRVVVPVRNFFLMAAEKPPAP